MAEIASDTRLKRFSPAQRLWHLVLIIVFMVLSVTGLAWMYIETPWGEGMAGWFGGIQNALEVHRIVGLVMLAVFLAHILWLIFQMRWLRRKGERILGPGSLVFLWRDVVGFFQHTNGKCSRGLREEHFF